MSPEELCDQWFAYTASNLKDVEPTVQALQDMERKEYARYNKQVKKAAGTPSSSKLNKNSVNTG